jgi:hypothetical protein
MVQFFLDSFDFVFKLLCIKKTFFQHYFSLTITLMLRSFRLSLFKYRLLFIRIICGRIISFVTFFVSFVVAVVTFIDLTK